MEPSNLKKRLPITDLERKNIRKRQREHPSTYPQLISWYADQPGGRTLTGGQISKILSKEYEKLDSDSRSNTQLSSKRRYDGRYPDHDIVLFEWQQRMQGKGAVITGDILKTKAHEIWERLRQYQDEVEPKWSNGWLDSFKKRYRIRQFVQHGEAATADIHSPANIAQMDGVRQLCMKYARRDIFNMDETGLFWKMAPNRTLATEALSGGKKSKDRITLAFTTNSDGSEKLDTWIIGTSKNPRCFKKVDLKRLRIQYRNNKSKWMTGLIMEEFLHWFDNKMRGRKVLLLLDNFSGHELGVELVGGLDGLENVRIAWLPPNTTSYWQPLDQGIIATFKLGYRKQWVNYMLRQLEADKNPQKTVNILKAIQWTRVAWEGVAAEKIQKCWWKSTVISNLNNEDILQDNAAEIEELSAQIARLPGGEAQPIEQFLEPEEERIVDEDGDIFESVIERYTAAEGDDVDDAEEGEEEEKRPSILDAIQAVDTLQSFVTLGEDGGRISVIKALEQLGKDILAEKQATMGTQSLISGWLTNTN
jgi:hypothetical protein